MRCKDCPALTYDGYETPPIFCGIGMKDESKNETKRGGIGCDRTRRNVLKAMRDLNEVCRKMSVHTI